MDVGPKKRSEKTNRALHKYFEFVADALNDAGLDIGKTITIDIPWSAITVKELLWRTVQKKLVDKKSTTQLTSEEVTEVFEVMNRGLSKRGLEIPFPSLEAMLDAYEQKHNCKEDVYEMGGNIKCRICDKVVGIRPLG